MRWRHRKPKGKSGESCHHRSQEKGNFNVGVDSNGNAAACKKRRSGKSTIGFHRSLVTSWRWHQMCGRYAATLTHSRASVLPSDCGWFLPFKKDSKRMRQSLYIRSFMAYKTSLSSKGNRLLLCL